jgi:hypothetical protein
MATSIIRHLKTGWGLALACAAIQSASAFSVFGPAEAWQVPTLDYVTRFYYGSTEVGAPKNYNEGSRINTPIVTYGYDITFLSYFGEKGVAAVDSAMATLNALPASSTANLSKYLMQGNQQINYTAQALGLTDLKSTVMSLMLEHMGLNGETHVWDLHTRNAEPGPPPCLFEYQVINRNFDPVTLSYSPYVNGVDYTFNIWDGCSNGTAVADAIEATVDNASAAAVTFTAVSTLYGLEVGGYYLGLTYDDVGGLKYLYSQNTYAYESLDPTAVVSSFSSTSSAWEGVSSTNATGVGVGVGAGVVSNFFGLLGGVEKITYVKLPSGTIFDGAAFTPRKFSYNIPWLTNGTITSVHITRTVTQPDIIFSANDLTGNTLGGAPFTYSEDARGFGFIGSPANASGDGYLPEVISPAESVTFNNDTPIYVNFSPFLIQQQIFPVLYWGSFYGSTNEPTVYPSGNSPAQLIAELYSGANSVSGPESDTWLGLSIATNPVASSATGGSAP